MLQKWQSSSEGDFHVRLETPWPKGNRVSSSSVISALEALSTTALSSFLLFLFYLTADAPPAPSPMHTLSHIPNDPATQCKHTQSTPGRQQGEAIVFLCAFYICVTLRLYRRVKDICTSHDAQYFLFSGHSNIWGVQKIGFLQTALNSMRFPFWDKKGKKLNTFILKQQLQHKLSAQSQLPSHCLRVRLKTERWHLCLKEIRPFSKDLEGLAGPDPVV